MVGRPWPSMDCSVQVDSNTTVLIIKNTWNFGARDAIWDAFRVRMKYLAGLQSGLRHKVGELTKFSTGQWHNPAHRRCQTTCLLGACFLPLLLLKRKFHCTVWYDDRLRFLFYFLFVLFFLASSVLYLCNFFLNFCGHQNTNFMHKALFFTLHLLKHLKHFKYSPNTVNTDLLDVNCIKMSLKFLKCFRHI